MAQCLYIRIWRNTDSHRIRYQTWRCLWDLIWFWFTHSFTIKLKYGANIREISEIAKGFLVFNTSGSPTDFTDEHRFLCGLGGLEFERVTQISQMTQIFLTYSVRFTQTFTFCTNSCPTDFTDEHRFFWPVRSDLRRLFANLCGSPCRGICLGGCEGGV